MSSFLREQGYEVRMFNLLDMENSDAWNCLSGIEKDKDLVQSIAEVIIKNTSNANERQDFWEKAELNLLMALMHYVATQTIPGTTELLPIQQRSLGAIYRMLSNESFGDLERRFEALPKGHPRWRPMVFSSWPTGRSGATSPLDWATACLCSKTLWWTKSPPTTRST